MSDRKAYDWEKNQIVPAELNETQLLVFVMKQNAQLRQRLINLRKAVRPIRSAKAGAAIAADDAAIQHDDTTS